MRLYLARCLPFRKLRGCGILRIYSMRNMIFGQVNAFLMILTTLLLHPVPTLHQDHDSTSRCAAWWFDSHPDVNIRWTWIERNCYEPNIALWLFLVALKFNFSKNHIMSKTIPYTKFFFSILNSILFYCNDIFMSVKLTHTVNYGAWQWKFSTFTQYSML